MKTEAALLSEIASAPTLREQAALVAELDALRNSKTARLQADRDWDAAGTVVEQTLTPVLVHSLHTASTDWLSESEIPQVDSNAVHAEASLWFGKTSSMVKADAEEFTEQAKGIARRLASQYGEAAPEAERAFMDYVSFLLRREGASGLDQIQQTVAPDGVTNKTTPLPEDVFDNFAEPIWEGNAGVDEGQSTENAPLLNEIMGEGGGTGSAEIPNHHDTAPQPSQNPEGGNGMQVGASLVDAPSLAQGYLYNLDDFLRAESAIQSQGGREPSDDQEDHTSSTDLSATAGSVPDAFKEHQFGASSDDDGDEDDEADKKTASYEKVAVIDVEAASSLPQVQQLIDVHDNPAPTPLPEEVAFPLIPYFEGQQAAQDDNSTAQPKEAVRKQADTFTPPAQNVGSPNPMLNKTHVGGEQTVAEPTDAMEKASLLSKQAAAEFRKGARFARDWKAGDPIVRQGSAEFEAGLYAGITANAANQEAWLAEHERWGATDQGIADRIHMHAAFTESIQAEAAGTEDLDTMSPGTNPEPGGGTPLNGPGAKPPLDGGTDPAAAGGPAPYNGTEPYGHPVAPDPGWMDPAKKMSAKARTDAFRQAVAANLQEA